MEYKTHFTAWNQERGEHEQETTTADKLTAWALYGREERGELYLFAIGGTESDNYSDNWDIYTDARGHLYSIARPGTTCGGTHYGDTRHIWQLMREGNWNDTLTPLGHAMMEEDGYKVA